MSFCLNDDFEFVLFDRIEKIKQINSLYDLENNSFIAFSGGKDSCILSYLIDLALPNNKIPRVFSNTGIEYNDMLKFVKKLSTEDSRIIILNQIRNIKSTLELYGYPFKSKEHSLRVEQFNKGSNANYIFNKYLNMNNISAFKCPKSLLYQFNERGKFNFSNKCCYKLKKDLQHNWQVQNKKKIVITGMRSEEGGNRSRLTCLSSNGKKFHPLIVCSEEWENYFINKYDIELCRLYYPPFNFKCTGCKGCPFNLNLQHDLDIMKKFLPNEYKQCEILWKPVYDEYRRIGFRLRKNDSFIQLSIFDFLD